MPVRFALYLSLVLGLAVYGVNKNTASHHSNNNGIKSNPTIAIGGDPTPRCYPCAPGQSQL